MNADRIITVERIGDFYEAVGESARRLHDVCGCTLTHRSDAILAGFPYHCLTAYVGRVNARGYTLAIQPAKPATRNGGGR